MIGGVDEFLYRNMIVPNGMVCIAGTAMEGCMEMWKKNLWTLWFTQIISIASFGFGLPFIPLYIKELQVLRPEQIKLYTTLLSGAPAVFMGLMAPIWGYLADTYGRKLMIMRAMLFAVVLISLMGMVTSVHQLLFLRITQGFFTGTVTAALAFVSANTPEKHLPQALGIISSSTFIGFSLGPTLGGLVAELYGYRISFYIGGALMLIGALVVMLFVKEDKSRLRVKSSGGSIVSNYKKILIPSIVLILGMLLLLRISRSLFSPYIPLLIASKYPSDKGVSFATGIVNGLVGISTAISSILIGRIIMKRSKTKVLGGLLFISLVLSIVLINYFRIADFLHVQNDLYAFVTIYVLLYFSLGAIEPVLSSTAAVKVRPENRGALSGLQGMISSMGWVIAPTISGFIVYDHDIEYVLLCIPVVIALNITLSLFLRRYSHAKKNSAVQKNNPE